MAKNSSTKIPRPPVVVVMGHVDHGKTTLLDRIRKTNVATREAGAITQSIGAYQVEHPSAGSGQARKLITFIDTPGHEAFTTMRARGAHVADLAILVVAAEESIKPQTKEAIKILEESKTPFVVAINKIDAPGADVEKTKNDLTSHNVLLEGYGGKISYQPISAKTGEGVDELLDLVNLTAELEEFTYAPDAPCHGYILETKTGTQRGIEATVIVRDGTLHEGDDIATASTEGKIKILENFQGTRTKEIHAGSPALVVGFNELPQAGETFFGGDYAHAHDKEPLAPAPERQPAILEKDKKAISVVLKAIDTGSLEALEQIVTNLKDNPLHIVETGVGNVTEGNVKLAIPTNAVIIGFKTRVDKAAKNLAEGQKIHILTSEIVYDLVKALEELSKEMEKAEVTGVLEVLAIFNQKKLERQLVGGKVTKGTFRKNARVKILRGEEAVAEGKIVSLREGKTDTDRIAEGKECGVVVDVKESIQVGDTLVIEEKRR